MLTWGMSGSMQSEEIKKLIKVLREFNLEKSASALDVLMSECVGSFAYEWSYSVELGKAYC